MKQEAKRIVSICPDLNGDSVYTKLLVQIETTLCAAARSEGAEYIVIGGSQPPHTTIGGEPAFPCNVPPTWLSLDSNDWIDIWSSDASRNFSKELRRVYRSVCERKGEENDTVFLLYHGHPCHLSSLIEFGLALGGRFPIVINLYWLHFVYGPNRSRRVPWLKEFLDATKTLRTNANLHLRVDSKRLADRILQDTGERVEVLPFFSPIAAIRSQPRPTGVNAKFKIAYPTAIPSREKGYDLVIGLAERLQGRGVEIVARASTAPTTEICLPTPRALAGGLRLLDAFMLEADYQNMLAGSDLVLVPYAAWQFESRTSGVVADAIAAGVPLLGPRETWIGDQIELAGAGRTFKNGDLDGLTSAVENIMDNYSQHLRNMSANAPAWLELNSAQSLIRCLIRCGIHRQRSIPATVANSYGRLKLAVVTRGWLPYLRRIQGPILRKLWVVSQAAFGRKGSITIGMVSSIANQRWAPYPSIRWDTRGVSEIELRLGSYDGFLIARGGKMGAVWPTIWIKSGQRIFLQDVTDGRPLDARHTLDACEFWTASNQVGPAKVKRAAVLRLKLVRLLRKRRRLGIGNLTLGLPSHWSGSASRAKLAWSQSGPTTQFELRTHGRVIARHDGPGLVELPKWVVAGMVFDLFDVGPDTPNHLRHLDSVRATRTRFGSSGGFLRLKENVLSYERDESGDSAPSEQEKGKLRFQVREGEWSFVVPPSTGEIYLLAAHSRAFLNKYGGDGIVIFGPPNHLSILDLFSHAPVRGEIRSSDDLGELLETRQSGSALRLDYGIGVTLNNTRDQFLLGRHGSKKEGFARLFLAELGMEVGEGMLSPDPPKEVIARAHKHLKDMNLPYGRTIILAPVSNSAPPPDIDAWVLIARGLLKRGFSVATNCGPKEEPVPGTVALRVSISELFAISELAGRVIIGRSGICDVLSCAKAQLHILYQDYKLVAFPGIEILGTLAENGLADTAIYHKMGLDESSAAFADRVLSHPDFSLRNAG